MVRGRRTRGPKTGDEPICTSPKRKDVKVVSSKLDKKMPIRRNKTTRLKSVDSATDPLIASPKSQITSYFHAVQPSMEPAKNGTELCYDYGDRSKESLKHHPWLAL